MLTIAKPRECVGKATSLYGRHDLILQLRQDLEDLLVSPDEKWSSQFIRRASSDCPSGKSHWTIQIEELDEKLASIPDRPPKVLLINVDSDLQELYGMYLERAGCGVDSVLGFDAAMRLYREGGPYDIVLLTALECLDLVELIRERNPEQAIALVGSCGATGCRFRYKIPILRVPFPRQALVRLVESAITPKVRVLLVAGDRCGDLWHFVWGHPESFEIELESNGDDALQRYRKHSPYDLVLTGFRIAGMDGSDLALAVRQENPAQRITMITGSSSAVRRSIQRKLGDIPVLREEDLFNAMGELRRAERLPEGEAQALLNSVDAAIEKKRSNALKSRKSDKEETRA